MLVGLVGVFLLTRILRGDNEDIDPLSGWFRWAVGKVGSQWKISLDFDENVLPPLLDPLSPRLRSPFSLGIRRTKY